MSSNRNLRKRSSGTDAAPRLSPGTHCVHCDRSLALMRSGAHRAKTEAGHICPEKLQSRQPAAPPPFN